MKNKTLTIAAVLFLAGIGIIIFKTAPIFKKYSLDATELSARKAAYLAARKNFSELKRIRVKCFAMGKWDLSTYVFTLLSFVEYLNKNGFDCAVEIIKSGHIYSIQKDVGLFKTPFSQYGRLKGVKEVRVLLKIIKVPNLSDYLYIFRVLRAMPVIVESVKIFTGENVFSSLVNLKIIGRVYGK